MNKFKIILLFFLFNCSLVFANPIINARTAIVIDYYSDEVLFELEPDAQIYPASMTKIMTSIIAFDLIKKNKNNVNKDKFFINIAEFYSKKSALFLKDRIVKDLSSFDGNKLNIKIKKTNKIALLSGPYTSINLMKNDYIQLKNFGFEELDININE